MAASFTGSLTVADAVPITTGARAVVTIDGATYVFDPEDGDELGTYYDPDGMFAQRNVLCANAFLLDFRAYYRPDVEGDREEWVFESGDPFDPAPVNAGPYTVEIVRNDGTLVTVDVPEHFHLSRWRWQSEPRPVRRTPEELANDKLLPHYDGSVIARYAKTHAAQTYTPMRLAGVMANGGTTGERPDIGIVTDWQADYLCVGEGLNTILAQGEAAGTFNLHVRVDDAAPMDLFEWPNASMASHSKSDPYILRTACEVDGAPLKYDVGHSAALAYVPFLLTGDPYYLEELQFQANMDVLNQVPASRWRLNGRYLAWSLRNTLYALAATPEHVPDWLLPRSYWQRHLDEYRAYVAEKMAGDNALHLITSGGSQATPGWPGGSYFAAWQEDFLTAVFAIAVRQGCVEWTDALVWKLDCTVQRVHSDNWHWPNPSPYQISLEYACALAAAVAVEDTTITTDNWGAIAPWPAVPFAAMVRDEAVTVTARNGSVWTLTRPKPKTHSVGHSVTGSGFGSWAECYARNRAAHPEIFPVNANDPDGSDLYTGKSSSVTYPGYTRGALALVVGEEVAGAESAVEPYEWIDGEFVRSASSSWKLTRKWAIQPGPTESTLAADLRLIVITGLRALAKLRRRP